VPFAAVGLDDLPLLGPPEVWVEASALDDQEPVYLGAVEADEQQIEHDVFEFAARRFRVDEHARKLPGASPAGAAAEHLGELPHADQALCQRLTNNASQVALGKDGGQIEDRPPRSGDSEAVPEHEIAPLEPGRAMHSEASVSAGADAGDGHVDWPVLTPLEHLPVRARSQMAQCRSRPAGLHRG
jgi:hypothetical protein